MTHEYTLLVNGTVIRGGGLPDATAVAWAHDTILAIGADAEIHAISRGDSHVLDLSGIYAAGAAGGVLEVGGPADIDIFGTDPRGTGGAIGPVAVIRKGVPLAGGRLEGWQPGQGSAGHGPGRDAGHGHGGGHGHDGAPGSPSGD
ncbi:MAG: hypothetical protein WCK58_15195 [Chloroflexota bacterium]